MTIQPNQTFDRDRGLAVRMSRQLTHIAKGGGLQLKRYNSFSLRALVASLLTLAVIAASGGPAGAQDGTDESQTLRAAALLFRHGAISPKYSPPKVSAEWPMGFKQLTAVGRRTMYQQGQELRRKYVEELGLIDGSYKGSEVYVRASNTDRALQTAQYLALGLFPLGTGPDPAHYDKSLADAPTPELAFNPVPIHTLALTRDSLLRPWTGKAGCKRYREFVKRLPRTELYLTQGSNYRDFLTRMAASTGVNEGQSPAKSLYLVNEIYEPLSAMVQHKMPLPADISEQDLDGLRELADWNYHHQFFGKGVGQLTGGPFVGEVISSFSKVIAGKPDARKMYLYSGHQRTILGLEAALGIETFRTEGPLFRGRVPPLASHYAFELHEPTTGSYAIQLKFVAQDVETIVPIPECGDGMCPFERFADILSKIVPQNWRQACRG